MTSPDDSGDHYWVTPAEAARLFVCAAHLEREWLVFRLRIRSEHQESIGVSWGVGSPWDHDVEGLRKDAAILVMTWGEDADPDILSMIDDAMSKGTCAWIWSQRFAPEESVVNEGPGALLAQLDVDEPREFLELTHVWAQEMAEHLHSRISAAERRLTGLVAAAPVTMSHSTTQALLGTM